MMLPLTTLQTWLHMPQLFGSLARLKPSSIIPLQLLSSPSQISTPMLVGVQLYSQPSESMPLAFAQPRSHIPTLHAELEQIAVACGSMQRCPHMPQLFASLVRLTPLSTVPSQSLS